jgi:hypothetical protein
MKLWRQTNSEILAAALLIELPELGGAAKLRALDGRCALISFEGY